MKISAFDILKCLFEPDETVCFRVFDDKKRGVFPGMKLECQLGKYAQMEPVLAEHNSHDRGVFYVVNYGGQSDDAISRVNAQFVEMDDCSFEEQQKKIDAFLLPPSMIIKTKRSLHVYWFMDKKAEVGRFRKIQEQLVKQFDGDPVCVNESRVMRLPGFNHCKGDTPVMVECILFHPERKYSQDQLSELLPDAEEKRVIAQKGTEKGLDIICRGCDFIKHCKEDAAHLAEHDWYAMITNLAPFEGGVELIHQLSKPYPGYDAQATQKKINHYFESGTRPINCVTIAEKGYRCPKLATGECSCKSPASMCYMPLDAETIVQMISELTITNDPISDNVKWAYKRLAEQGIRHIGNNRVVGYDEVDGTLEPNAQAWIPKLIFTEYADGKPVKDIIKLLKKRGAKRLRSENSYNPSTVYYILKNEMYVGDRRLQKEPHTDYRTKKPVPGGEYASYYIENDHEGIISREMWDTVQARLKQEEERKANGVYSSSREHFMHGKLFCGDCGMPLTRRTIKYQGKQQKVWKCKGRLKDCKSCQNDVISEEDLFKALSEHLGIKWKGVEAVTEKTFDRIKKVVLFNDGRIEVEMAEAA